MKREDGRKLFRAFLGNSRETAGEQRAMMEQMAVPSRERSLYSMVEHLLSLDETAWYLYAWSRDPLEGRFSREQKLAYGFRAAECGRSEAQLILGKTDVWDIAAGMGLKVLTPQVPGGGGHVIFAQYQEPDSITIFMDGAERAQKLIREEKLEDVLDALAALDVHGMTCYQVMGCGTQRGFKEYAYVRGHQQVEIQMLPKIKIEVLVSSEEWEKKTIDAIQKAAYTGNIGDGKIFSYDVREAMRIRTKETGYDAIQPE